MFPKPLSLHRSSIPYWVLGIGLLLTTLATAYAESTTRAKDWLRFENAVQRTEDNICNRIELYVALLRAGSGLFAGSTSVTQQEFRSFVNRIELTKNYPGVQGIGFATKASSSELPALYNQLQQQGLTNFQIKPDFPRPDYYPVIYLEPPDHRNQVAIGFDMFTEPVRRAAMERSRDQGSPAASGKVTLVQEIEVKKQAGFLIYLPVYREGSIPPTIAERRAALVGFVYSPFRASDLLNGIWGSDPPLVDFSVYDGQQVSPQTLLHQPSNLAKSPRFTAQSTIQVAGRTWTIQFSSRPEFEHGSGAGFVPYVAATGLLLSLVLFWLTRSQALTYQRAQRSTLELQQSEEQLRLALETTQMGIWDWNILTNQVTWSANNERLFGLQPGSFAKTYDAFLQHVHPSDRERVTQAITAALTEQRSYESEFRILWPDDSVHWITTKSQLIRDQAGKPVRMIGVTMDITLRKQAELAIRQQTEREQLLGTIGHRIRQSLQLPDILRTTVAEVRQFLQVDRVLIWQLQPDGSGIITVESIAPDSPSLLGAVFPSSSVLHAFLADYHQGQVSAIADRETTEISPLHGEIMRQFGVRAGLVIPLLQGENLWGLLVAHQCYTPRQWQPFEIELLQRLATQLAIAIQQSELYQQVQQLNTGLEQQVQERTAQLQQAFDFEARLKRITDKVRDSLDESHILQTAVEELALGLNVACCNTALYDFERSLAVISYEFTTLPSSTGRVVQMQDLPEIYHQLLQGQYFQFCLYSPTGANSKKAILACSVFDDQGILGDLWLFHHADHAFSELEVRLVQQVANQCAIAVRQARLYQAAQAQVKVLERLHWLKDDFLSTVSHELRTPVSNMKMAIRMLEITLNQASTTDKHQQKATQYLQILHNECQREISLINDLLDLQRLEAGVHSSTIDMVYLQDWLLEITKPFQERAHTQHQTLKVELPNPNMPPLVSDITSLERILSELLNNACKYTPPGETISITAQSQPGWIELSVSNSGAEIPASELTRIFDKFYRIPNADPWKQGGTGLGLALVQRLAEHLGGKILVRSENALTTFTLQVPDRLLQTPTPKASLDKLAN